MLTNIASIITITKIYFLNKNAYPVIPFTFFYLIIYNTVFLLVHTDRLIDRLIVKIVENGT